MAAILQRHNWDVDEWFVLPKLAGVVVNGEINHDTVDVTNDYYDTPEHDLRANGVELRRRDGDGKAGWQLDIPDNGGRTKLRWPLSDAPPAEVVALLTGLTLGKPIDSFAKIHTVRDRYRMSARDGGEVCAEVDDDRVRASVGEKLLAWRELEVEPGARPVAKRLAKRLRSAGALPSRYSSKLAHVCPPSETEAAATPAAKALVDYMYAQVDQIVAGDIGLRRGRDPIHDTRVAIRRLRSTLRVFHREIAASAVGDLEGELKWFAGLLGEVRDCDVQQRRFSEALDEFPAELVLGPVAARIRTDLEAIQFPARTVVSEAMESPRYLAIMAVLRRWRDAPPVGDDVTTGALRKRARKAGRKADRRLSEALKSDAGDDAEIGALLHRARKAAKRARYTAELCQPLDKSKRTKRSKKHFKRIQRVLGDHQDTVVASEALRRMAVTAGTTVGENGFTYGMLYAREQEIARQCRRDVLQLL
jgi:CHAD domain-containing protein